MARDDVERVEKQKERERRLAEKKAGGAKPLANKKGIVDNKPKAVTQGGLRSSTSLELSKKSPAGGRAEPKATSPPLPPTTVGGRAEPKATSPSLPPTSPSKGGGSGRPPPSPSKPTATTDKTDGGDKTEEVGLESKAPKTPGRDKNPIMRRASHLV